jgi:hypothetical protein
MLSANGVYVSVRIETKPVYDAIKTLTNHFAREWSQHGQWCGFCGAKLDKRCSTWTVHRHPCPFHALKLALQPGNGSIYGRPPA